MLDIGAAPGSWSQLAQKLVGQQGQVVAVDIQAMRPIPNVTVIQGDIRDSAVFEQIQAVLRNTATGSKVFNTVISDIAPNTSGIRARDHARSIELSLFALTIALQTLRQGGNFVTKVFMGEDFNDLLALTRRYFKRASVFNPDATRRESKETFIVGKNLRTNATLDAALGLEALLGD